MQRMLVGVDGSPAARHALMWSADLAHRAGLDLTAARVYVPTQAEIAPDDDVVFHDRQRQELDGWCASLPAGTTAETMLVDGVPPEALLAAAQDRDADLLVVGGRGAGGFVHLHLGSVAHHLTHHTTLPLAIVPGTAPVAVTHLVAGVDGSAPSLAAVDLVADLAAHLGVGVTAVYAFDPLLEWVAESDRDSWRRHAEADVRHWAAAVDKADVPIDLVVDRDVHPVAALARALDAHPGAVAAVGTRGLGGFVGLRLGRVPLQLVHQTGAAVILVPPPPLG